MKLIVGLGNPGSDYRDTYHNVGFTAVDMLAAGFSAPDFSFDKKSNSRISEISVGGKVMLCEPETYMNLSGNAVAYLARYYKLAPQDILVIYDDIDIAKGTVRARLSGSAGTHNGMRDIVAKLNSTEFARVRIGTGFKPNYMELKDYVLSHIGAADKPTMSAAYSIACDYARQWIKGETWQDLTKTVK
ncbi:MAG: aminoacyl-tRNA hydrolase [Clostridiales bacterium]|nr:aminoacyl-tRNA hydrolase [Clostridiales bacterium]